MAWDTEDNPVVSDYGARKVSGMPWENSMTADGCKVVMWDSSCRQLLKAWALSTHCNPWGLAIANQR